MANVRVQVPQEFRRWVEGLTGGIPVTAEAALLWTAVGETMFIKTQEFVHVLSGDLKASGRLVETQVDGHLATFEIEYGGTATGTHTVDYAPYEIARGGTHDFPARAARATEEMFEGAVSDMLLKMIEDAVN